ncbi:rhodanese-like domain-containing protein [Mycolicibacterium sp. S2-37]|uniref:rhodanese-like domain-containing protein n=1 Tax=Mycolicibacterium sp. S2-37 TaxID=2810297 RepID=UPI001A944B6E|nr:rhodanese-like domain-containing protein [Mycolicibacterium sp. S2-37]MBO0679807.1 rhodanese-like domain-containing protein [Mycolicibacterium sp. S2-37]MBO0681204.1 rhodanese-like domain-containing protein [Mycolicibacterium sp. S2-37]
MDDVDVPQVAVSELPSAFDGAKVLLDVREPDEWLRGHAPDATHVPMGEVPARVGDLETDTEYFVVCHGGGRSQRVAAYLVRNGYRAANVSGGMLAWAEAGRPVVTDGGDQGSV